MKKETLFAATFCMVFGTIFAQSSDLRLSKWSIGASIGVNFSKTYNGNTFNQNFTNRNKRGYSISPVVSYEVSDHVSINSGLGIIRKGYRINNDTLQFNTDISRGFFALNIPLGISFKQRVSKSRFFVENIGVIANYSFRNDIDTFYNSTKKEFRIIERNLNKLYPLLYFGICTGSRISNGNNYNIGVCYQSPIKTEMKLDVSSGEFLNTRFPLNFRGGTVQVSLTYCFNIGNMQKSSEYLY
ncbi:MAG: PorT family protein [Flavobacteriaceae bacterium]|nr:PorT family protein [Flavobacteriaceae bacterium]